MAGPNRAEAILNNAYYDAALVEDMLRGRPRRQDPFYTIATSNNAGKNPMPRQKYMDSRKAAENSRELEVCGVPIIFFGNEVTFTFSPEYVCGAEKNRLDQQEEKIMRALWDAGACNSDNVAKAKRLLKFAYDYSPHGMDHFNSVAAAAATYSDDAYIPPYVTEGTLIKAGRLHDIGYLAQYIPCINPIKFIGHAELGYELLRGLRDHYVQNGIMNESEWQFIANVALLHNKPYRAIRQYSPPDQFPMIWRFKFLDKVSRLGPKGVANELAHIFGSYNLPRWAYEIPRHIKSRRSRINCLKKSTSGAERKMVKAQDTTPYLEQNIYESSKKIIEGAAEQGKLELHFPLLEQCANLGMGFVPITHVQERISPEEAWKSVLESEHLEFYIGNPYTRMDVHEQEPQFEEFATEQMPLRYPGKSP